MNRSTRLTLSMLALLLAASTAHAARMGPRLRRVERLVDQWRIKEASAALEPLLRGAPQNPRVLQLKGEVLLHRARYKEAGEVFRQAVRASRTSTALKALRDLAESTAAATKDLVKHASPGGHFEIWTARGKDELLVPFAAETLESTREALKRDLGFAPKEPIRVEIYRSPQELARVSPLTVADIERSGTIALCKFSRLMAVTPRALLRGYSWRDTLAHEYVHLAVTRLSDNTVPIWLHEGLAKYFEARWRLPPGELAPLSPAQEHLLARALRRNRIIRWEQMYPSMAKLPSQEATALAFAQVQTAVELLGQKIGLDGLRRVITAVRRGKPAWDAVREVSKLGQDQFTRAWKQHLRGRNLRLMADLVPPKLRFGERPSREKRLAAIREARARRFLRLAMLLRTRHRTRAAIIEYEKARKILGPRDDLVANQLARAYLDISSPAQAISALMPVLEYYPELPGPQVTMGVAYLRNHEPAQAERHLKAALRINPFSPELHCSLAVALKGRHDAEARRHSSLCDQLR